MGNVYIDRKLEEKIIEARLKGKHNMDVTSFVKEAVKHRLREMGVL